MDEMEIDLAMEYIGDVNEGTFSRDDSPLIKEVDPLKDAIALCGSYT